MKEPGDSLEAAFEIARTLAARGISYAIGGAHAYGLHGVPRATNDVDVNVFVPPEGLPAVLDALRSLGLEVETAEATRTAHRDGAFTARYGLFRVDVFTPSTEFSGEAERTRVRAEVDGEPAWFLSAEALCVFKLLFFRGKDLVDLERLVAVQRGDLDTTYVRRWVIDLVGEDDPRATAWDRIVREYGDPNPPSD